MNKHYQVAGHTMAVSMSPSLSLSLAKRLSHYEPFAIPTDASTVPLFHLEVTTTDKMPDALEVEWRQDEEGQEIICGHIGTHPAFVFRWWGATGGILTCSADYREATLQLFTGKPGQSDGDTLHHSSTIDNALMVLFALASAPYSTLLFHASTVSRHNHAYLFLGKSGTGKSTHSRLWLRHVTDTELVNDDNPVVRILDNQEAWVYGSPWSGKTPCYRNVGYPIGGIVGLAQAPHNAIRHVRGLEAYALLTSSISGKRWDRCVADGLHHSVNQLISNTPIWHLDCLPDADAAILCSSTL